MPLKIAEYELTKFLKEQFKEALELRLEDISFHFLKKEKRFRGKKFDLYTYDKKSRRFVVWELEIAQPLCEQNVIKIENTILDLSWPSKVYMFHIFSPRRSGAKKLCLEEAKRLKTKYPRRFVYLQFDIEVKKDRFEDMVRHFQSKKFRRRAKRRYGKDLRKEIKRIVRQTISRLS